MLCISCLYSLAELPSDRCPECGRRFDKSDFRTFTRRDYGGWPLLGQRLECWLSSVFADHRWVGYLFLAAAHIGPRAWGSGFLVMMLLMAVFEGDRISRTHWYDVWIMNAILAAILIGMFAAHVILQCVRRARLFDPVGVWSYGIGIVWALLIFWSPMRP